jgi:hypothetical protein
MKNVLRHMSGENRRMEILRRHVPGENRDQEIKDRYEVFSFLFIH